MNHHVETDLVRIEYFAVDAMLHRARHHLLVLVHAVLLLGHPQAPALPEAGVPAAVLQVRVQVAAHHGDLGLEVAGLQDAHEPRGVPGGAAPQLPLHVVIDN